MKKEQILALICAIVIAAFAFPAAGFGEETVLGIDRPFEITSEQSIIETDRFLLEIEAGVYVPNTISEDMRLVMDTAEAVTGLTFYPSTPVHPAVGKVRIEVVTPALHGGDYPAYGGLSGVTISAPDIIIRSGQGWALLHELLHCLQFRNGSVLSPTLAEGFSTTHVLKAASSAPFPIALDSYGNYASEERVADAKNAQKQFLALDQTEDNWNCYLYGFPMVLFMNETCGEEAFLKLISLPKDEYSPAGNVIYVANHTNRELLPDLLAVTSEDFFTLFGKWYEGSRARFASRDQHPNDYARFDRLDVFPMCYAFNYYDCISTAYNGSLILDYTTGNTYLAEYKRLTPLGFSGRIAAQGQSTFAFYAASGELLEAVTLNGDSQNLSVEGACVLKITGDGQTISVEANFDAMTRS